MNKQISFAQQVKEELASNEYESKDRLRALLSAFIRINGHVSFHKDGTVIILTTEHAKIAKFFYTTTKELYGVQCQISYFQKKNLNKHTVFEIDIIDKNELIINDLYIDFMENKISKEIVKNDDMISGYLAGAFMASGSVNSPSTSNYHLELCLNNENYARWMLHLFNRYKNVNIEPKIIKRRGKYVVYFKKSDQIAEFLIMIGAVNSCMEFENIRVDRDFTNSTNRLANFDVANMKKSVAAGAKQVKQIEFIDQVIGIDTIRNPKARLLCKLRMENESASNNELAYLLSQELGYEVSRSNINHLFRYIANLYERIS